MRYITGALFFIFVSMTLVAEESDNGSTLEPPEPEIVLPQVVLELEDTSIESIDAVIPEDDIGIPVPILPLPDESGITIVEPEISIVENDPYEAEESEKGISAEILFGAGLVNYLTGRISIYKPIGDLRYGIEFLHDTVDGFSFEAPGSGYSKRIDSLDGTFKIVSDTLDFSVAADFTEKELGLQKKSDYYSEALRFLDGNAEVAFKPVDFFSFTALALGRFTSFSLTGNNVVPFDVISETVAGGEVKGQFYFLPGTAGISLRYVYRNAFEMNDMELHRFLAMVNVGAEFDSGFFIKANGGFSLSSTLEWCVPFDIGIGAVLSDRASVAVHGGYRVVEHDVGIELAKFDYTYPSIPFRDSRGWFANAGGKLTLTDDFLLSFDIGFAGDSFVLEQGPIDATTGLLVFSETNEAVSFNLEGGFMWNFAEWGTFAATDKTTLYMNITKPAKTELRVEGNARSENDTVTATVGATVLLDYEDPVYLPLLDAAVSLKIGGNARLSLEGKDLLSPLLDNRRVLVGPFISEGIQVFLKILITM